MGFGNIGLFLSEGDELGADERGFVNSLVTPEADVTVSWRSIGRDSGPTVTLSQSTVSTTPEDLFHPGDRVLNLGSTWIVADARLDNRRYLVGALGIRAPESCTDEALILSAYQRWGTRCGRHLRGDFAFIIVDQSSQLVLACRDPLGVRTLAYAQEDGRVVVASTIAGVRSCLRRRPRPNVDFLEKFLRRRSDVIPGPTAYDSIRWLRPGHQIEIRGRSMAIVGYDALVPKAEPIRSSGEAFAQFRDRLNASVEARMRARHDIGFTLSGGFDSSSILSIAESVAAAGRCSMRLRSYTADFRGVPGADEGDYLDPIITACPHVESVRLPWRGIRWSMSRLDERDGFPLDEPPKSSRFLGALLAKRAADDGCRVIIRGAWGDELLLTPAYHWALCFWDLPPLRAIEELPHFAKFLSPRSAVRTSLLAPWLGVRQLAARFGGPPVHAPAMILSRRFAYGADASLLVYASRIAKWGRTEYRMPFLDRDLIEFVMSLPTEYFFRDGKIKRLLREGLAGQLPPVFQGRRHETYNTNLWVEGMNDDRDEITALLRESRVVAMGLMPGEEVSRLVASITPTMSPALVGRIHPLVATEVWLRRQEA